MTRAVHVIDAAGHVLRSEHPDAVVRTASVGKVLLLLTVERLCSAGELGLTTARVRRTSVDQVTDSGLWHLLAADTLTLGDACTLVGAVSDNLATNALLRHIGLATVQDTASSLGLQHTRLHDQVRDQRRASDPPTLSTGTARELATLMLTIVRDWPMTRGWLSANTDLSMVASAFVGAGLVDPIAHHASLGGLALFNKTGTDAAVRADVGAVDLGGGWVGWAALCDGAHEQATGGVREQRWAADALDWLGGIGRSLLAQPTT